MTTEKAESTRIATFSTIFAFLWGMATLFHISSYRLWTHSVLDFLLVPAALWLLAKPSSINRLALLALFQLAALFEVLPRAANHWLFTGFINLTFLIALLLGKLRGKSRDQIFSDFLPAARWELIILWIMAAFHKLNRDYFIPATSCATLHHTQLIRRLPIIPASEAGQYFAIYSSFLIEAGIPILLLFRRTRTAGIFLGAFFHFILGLSPFGDFYNFSAMLVALYYLFAPENFPELLADWVKRFPKFVNDNTRKFFYAAVVTLVAIACLLSFLPEAGRFGRGVLNYAPIGAWLVYGLSTLAVFFLALRSGKPVDQPNTVFLRTSPAMTVCVLVVLLNGFSPYLGIKTEMSFSMFSNLHTEMGKSNHFIIRKCLHLNGYADDVAMILDSSDPRMMQYVKEGNGITMFELRSYVSTHPDISLTFERAGVRKTLARAGEDPDLGKPIPLLMRKFLSFRPVQMGDSFGCQH